MNNLGKSFSLLVMIFLACGEIFLASAATPLKMEKNHASKGDAALQAKVMKTTGIIKKMDDSTLVLQNGRKYSLKGVKVFFSRDGQRPLANKKLAEMMFVNDRLVEVVVK